MITEKISDEYDLTHNANDPYNHEPEHNNRTSDKYPTSAFKLCAFKLCPLLVYIRFNAYRAACNES